MFPALPGVANCSYLWLGIPMNTAQTTIEVHGPAIRAIRTLSGLGVAELAEAVGVNRPYIAKIELGHSRRVSPKVFNAIVSALALEDRRAILASPYGASPEVAA